jgi:thioredoxin-related protein
MGPILETVLNKYRSTGLTLVAPTKLYGYVAQRKAATPAEETAYIRGNRDEFYPWMSAYPTPVSEDVFARYGVSTTPTLVLIARDGKVATYHPGQMTIEQLEPLVQRIAGTPATSSQQ